MLSARASVALAALASVALPLVVKADPPQPAAGFLLPAGTLVTLVLDERLDSASTSPGAQVFAHLRNPIVVHNRTLAHRGTRVVLTVTQTRRASQGVDGEVVLRASPLKLSDENELPLRLVHPALSPLLVYANPEDVGVPGSAPAAIPPPHGLDLILPSGTLLRARTAATLDASDPRKTVVVTPPPFTLSTDKPYAAFTPIPLYTYNPAFSPPPRSRRGARVTPTPSPTPSPTPTPTPSPSPTAEAT